MATKKAARPPPMTGPMQLAKSLGARIKALGSESVYLKAAVRHQVKVDGLEVLAAAARASSPSKQARSRSGGHPSTPSATDEPAWTHSSIVDPVTHMMRKDFEISYLPKDSLNFTCNRITSRVWELDERQARLDSADGTQTRRTKAGGARGVQHRISVAKVRARACA